MALTNIPKKFLHLFLMVLLIHAVTLIYKTQEFKLSQTQSNPITIKIENISPEEILKKNKNRQIVESEDSPDKKEMDNSFLSDKTRSFDKQTIARKVDTFKVKKRASGGATKTVEKKKIDKNNLSLGQLAQMAISDVVSPHVGVKSQDKVSQESSSNDYVEKMVLGDFTQLNSVEYKFYGFFHRIKQKLEQFWGQSIHEKSENLFRSGRRLPANENLITSLRITLDNEGKIIHVKILGTSGIRELDDAAIESFNKAGPFPNPPKDLLVNGKATIEWGFVVKS